MPAGLIFEAVTYTESRNTCLAHGNDRDELVSVKSQVISGRSLAILRKRVRSDGGQSGNTRGEAMTSLRISGMCVLILILLANAAWDQSNTVLFREDFEDLDNWRTLLFPKIRQHSTYTIVKAGNDSFLKAESNASASGLIYRKEFNVYDYPKVRWRWKISNVYAQGNELSKSGDDYPIRIYVVFKYDPDTAAFGQKIKYGFAKKIYGEYPPHSSLNYIWANKKHAERIITNAYSSEAKMVLLEAGAEKVNRWIEEEIDILDDYQKAFETKPPAIASIAIMNDSDNTGERSESFVDYIEIFR